MKQSLPLIHSCEVTAINDNFFRDVTPPLKHVHITSRRLSHTIMWPNAWIRVWTLFGNYSCMIPCIHKLITCICVVDSASVKAIDLRDQEVDGSYPIAAYLTIPRLPLGTVLISKYPKYFVDNAADSDVSMTPFHQHTWRWQYGKTSVNINVCQQLNETIHENRSLWRTTLLWITQFANYGIFFMEYKHNNEKNVSTCNVQNDYRTYHRGLCA